MQIIFVLFSTILIQFSYWEYGLLHPVTIEGDRLESKVHGPKMNKRNLKSVNVKVFIIINTNVGQRVSGLRTSVWGLSGLAVGQTGVSGDGGWCSSRLAQEGMVKRNLNGQGGSPSFPHPLTGGKEWCTKPVHRKYIARKWTMYPAFTHSVHLEYIQNFPYQFPCNFPSPGNDQYIHSVPGHVTAMFPLGHWWGHPEFPKESNCNVPSGSFRKSLQFSQWCDCSVPGHVTAMSPLGNWWEHLEFSQRRQLWCSQLVYSGIVFWFSKWCDHGVLSQ